MMGEYLLYYRKRLFAGIYDNRFLVKPVLAAKAMMPDAVWESPYDGAKPMLLVDQIEDKLFLKSLVEAMYNELPVAKQRKKE